MSRFLTDSLDGIEIIQANSVIKHGTHDQKTHGNWATGGMGAGVADSILSRVRENGGLSVNMVDGSEPTSGYMVAKGAKYGSVVSADDFYDPIKGPKILADYMKKHKKELGGGKNYLGLWHNKDDGQVYLDVSENIQDRERAISAGQKQDQISIWDVTNFAEIETGGTGNVEKTGSGRTASQHRRYERFGNRSLRPKNLGEVGKAYKVIRFEAGLIPVLKHGEHDQKTHGNWATGYTDEEIARMEAMSTLGPALEDLDAILEGGGEEPGYDDLKMLVENDQGLYKEAIDGIEERVAEKLARLQEEFPNHEYTEQEKSTIYEDVQAEMIDEFIDNSDPGYLAGLWMEQNGGGDTEQMLTNVTPYFEEIFNTDHTVVNAAGDAVTTLGSRIQDVSMTTDTPTGEEGISVKGEIEDSEGNFAGEFERVFYKQDGVWVVEHKLLKLQDEYKGLGFGKEFIDRSEDWYTQRGFGAITVGTGWDGARVWARDGFDWDPESSQENFEHIVEARISGSYSGRMLDEFQFGEPARVEFDALMERATNGYVSDENGPRWDSIKDFRDENFPLPNDFLMIGYKDKTTSDYEHPLTGETKKAVSWAGERLLQDLNLKYVKILTPEGRNLFEGPIDRDGDGLVYDGTAREKPASAVKS
jgi:GNAT superfamily N-acetyltransferase